MNADFLDAMPIKNAALPPVCGIFLTQFYRTHSLLAA